MGQNEILRCLENTGQQQPLIARGEMVLVALSGGPDSVALTHLLWRLKDRLGLKLHLAHLNHGLRREADREERWVKAWAGKLGLPLISQKADVRTLARQKKMSLEEAARTVRYQFLEKTAREVGAAKIALAHTADDQVETVLLWLIRGAGAGGLRGMPWQRGQIVRPLLGTWKTEILEYLRRNRLSFCLDRSNSRLDFTRNRIRRRLLPYLAGFNPRIKESLWRTADILAEEDAFLLGEVDKIASRASRKRRTGKLGRLAPAIQRRLLRQLISREKGDLKRINFGHIEKIRQMLDKTDWQLDLPGLVVSRETKGLGLVKRKKKRPTVRPVKAWLPVRLRLPGTVYLPQARLKISARLVGPAAIPWKKLRSLAPRTVYLDPGAGSDHLKKLMIRFRRPGDRFFPLGAPGSRKLKNFFIDRKVPRDSRDSVPLLVAGTRIAWVIGHEISQLFCLTSRTRRALKLTCHRV